MDTSIRSRPHLIGSEERLAAPLRQSSAGLVGKINHCPQKGFWGHDHAGGFPATPWGFISRVPKPHHASRAGRTAASLPQRRDGPSCRSVTIRTAPKPLNPVLQAHSPASCQHSPRILPELLLNLANPSSPSSSSCERATLIATKLNLVTRNLQGVNLQLNSTGS
jgi:hypothetical protein